MGLEEKAVRPEVMQLALLDEIAGRLLTLEKHFASTEAEGVVEPIEPITVTSTAKQIRPTKPWFSVEIVNDGPDSVLAIINTLKSFDAHDVKKDETYKVEMGKPIIKDVYMKCNPGETAIVRLVGTR